MKKHFVLFFVTLLAVGLYAAAPVVTNVIANPQSGQVVITYTLSHADGLACEISVEASADGGANYTIFPTALSGDIGTIQATSAGADHQIIWVPGQDNVSPGDNYRVKVIADDGQPLNMIYVPGGTFVMGDTIDDGVGYSAELPTHSVTLDPFYIGKYEVTQGEWTAIMGSNPAHDYGVGDNYPVYFVSWYDILKYCNLRSMAEGLTPVYSISGSTNPADWGDVPNSSNSPWDAAICNWNANGYRLPTEAEWEYAARGATNNPDYLYSGSDDINAVAWYDGNNSPNGTKPVGTKAPNGIGTYDMSGNVWEWCWDWYSSSYYNSSPQNNPTGPASGSFRLLRGGTWYINDNYCRVAIRGKNSPDYRSYYIGFRVSRAIN